MDSTTDADASPATDLAIRRVPLDCLHVDPANARAHGEGNIEAIVASLARFAAGAVLSWVEVSPRRGLWARAHSDCFLDQVSTATYKWITCFES